MTHAVVHPSPVPRSRRGSRRRLLGVLALALAGLAVMAFPLRGGAQSNGSEGGRRTAFALGESMVYDVKYGMFNVGTARMDVVGIDTVRGRPAWHTKLEIEGGIPGYRVHDVLESWIDVATFNSLRYRQETSEGRRQRTRTFEIIPERGVYRENDKPEMPTVPQPLDEGAFIYFVRNQPLEVGRTHDYERYFMPDRNPVTVLTHRRERVTVPAGSFETIVVKPVIKAKGIFSKNGRAELWFTDDARRLLVRMVTHVAFGTISLQLREFTQGSTMF